MPHYAADIENWDYFWTLGVEAVKELETERGILASAKSELFGCIFGRDSLITSHNLLRVYQQTGHDYFLQIVRKVLLTMADLQGKSMNIESGEEPGKIIHEYRPENHEHLTAKANPDKPWYLYPDNIMRNYDTVDATPLFLITAYRYWQTCQKNGQTDPQFIAEIIPSVKAAINWIFWYGDSNGDGLIDYQFRPERTYGGLVTQSWMDSAESVFHEDGQPVPYPIAPVEAQAYTYLALKLWANYFKQATGHHRNQDRSAAVLLEKRAIELKQRFSQEFVIREGDQIYIASAVDGAGRPLHSVRSSMGHCLWASLNKQDDGELDSILEIDCVDAIAKQLLAIDMFVPDAGIRTLSSKSRGFNPNSYHNGSIWPHDNSMIAEGLDNVGYTDEAWLVRIALLKAVSHFKHPLELYVYDQDLTDYHSPTGQVANKTQAWAAAAILTAVAPNFAHHRPNGRRG